MSTINKISPSLRRYVPGTIKPKYIKESHFSETSEKEEEELKNKTDMDDHQSYKLLNSRKNSFEPQNDLQSNALNKSLLENLDKCFEKVYLGLKSREKEVRRDCSLENIFKKRLTKVVTLKSLQKSSPSSPLVKFKVHKEESEKGSEGDKKFIGRKRSLEETSKEGCSLIDSPKIIFKAFKSEDSNPIKIESINTNSSMAVFSSQSSNISTGSSKNLSLFDKFFLTFKKSIYPLYKVVVQICKDKREFLFCYERKQKDSVIYRVVYDQQSQLILSIEKKENENLVLELKSDSKLENFGAELKNMLDDIVSNVEKKQ